MKLISNIRASRAMMYQSTYKEEKAKGLYEKAYIGGTNNSGALSAYSLLLLRNGDFKKAAKVAGAAKDCAKKPRLMMHARMNRGLAMWKLGRIDDAIRTYENLYAELKTSAIYGTLGFLYIAKGDETGDYGRALTFNAEAVEYDGEDAVLLDNLAQTRMRIGQWEEAERGFRRALAIREEQFDSLVCLARCLHRRGEEEEAKELIRKALERPFSHLNTVDRSVAEELAKELDVGP